MQDPYCPVELSCRRREQTKYFILTEACLIYILKFCCGVLRHTFAASACSWEFKETGCSNKFSAFLTPSKSTELSQQKLLLIIFKVSEMPVCWAPTWHRAQKILPAEEENSFCAKQATSVSLSIPVHFRRTSAPDYSSQTVLNFEFSIFQSELFSWFINQCDC